MSKGSLSSVEPAPHLITRHTPPKSPCLDDTFSRHPERCDVAKCMAATDHPSCGVKHRTEKAERLGIVTAPARPAQRRYREPYTIEEAQRALALRGRGMSWQSVGMEIGRTSASAQKLVVWYKGLEA